jgi:hypothetical protein
MSDLTQFMESNALLAVQSGDKVEADRILSKMTLTELRELRRACDELAYMTLPWIKSGGDDLGGLVR